MRHTDKTGQQENNIQKDNRKKMDKIKHHSKKAYNKK